MRRLTLAAAVVLVGACGTAATSSLPSVTSPAQSIGTPSASPSPSAHTRLAGSVVQVSVNGVAVAAGAEMTATSDPPATVLITFPFAVDRASVERWLPRSAPFEWRDDRTLRLTIEDANAGFKVAETLSADGSSTIEFFIVNVAFPSTHTVEVYAVSDLTSGPTSARPSETYRLRLPQGWERIRRLNGAMALSRDASLLLLSGGPTAPALHVIEIKTGAIHPVAMPVGEADLAFAGWLGDGKLLLVGAHMWLGDPLGARMSLVSDLVRHDGSSPRGVAPFGARLVALGYPDGETTILDLSTAIARPLTQRFRPCAGYLAASLTWSLDGALLAGTDCDGVDPPAKVRIVDVAADRTVRTVEGGAYRVSTFANGHFLIHRDSAIQGEGAPSIGVEITIDGSEVRRYTGGGGWTMSPDGRYVLQSDQLGGAASSLAWPWRLIDTQTGRETQFQIPPGLTEWRDDALVDVNTYR